ncbi:RNA polymerase recycling motor HelD [Virgibacillus saliphilus]|uniref:RNA polymerase recycling motor HelD n=1 Tax=Virgibacillus saliphilus TaxID=2831674 RepID=UPI002103844D|nr:RNA polymerase recycling motor HelD [Virgibacillus sp. NKC19-3]
MDERAMEQRRVDNIIEEIKTKEDKLYQQSKGLKADVVELRRTFWDDITVNVEEMDDVIETQESIKQQATLLSQKERFHGKVGERLKTLDRLKDSPYFGRIDFKEDAYTEKEAIYIGVSSLMDKDDQDFLVYDWRAPISSLYYDYSTGKASYRTRETTITGDVTLKRQFIIRHGSIEGMFDTGVTIGDQILQRALGNNASTMMKSIVATIQQEQNQIIRNERSSLLVVQGVAGSGKTSAALQRIAYLMYRYRETLHADNVMLLSPNPLFSSYISNVLPELGETNVRQMTFLNYMQKRIMDKFTIESPFEQMEYVLAQGESQEYTTRMKSMKYLASLDFKAMIDAYVEKLHEAGIQFKRIAFRGETIASKQQIYDYFYALDEDIAIPNKLELVAKWLLEKVQMQQKEELNKDWVMEKVELLDKEDYMEAYHQSEGKEDGGSITDEEEILRSQMVKRVFAPLKERVRNLEFVHIPATYQALFAEWKPEQAPTDWQEMAASIQTQLKERYLTWENATPYLYFQSRIFGDTTDRSVRQMIIDEAQDYSAFQFAYIRYMFPYTRMTLLGDTNQAIYTYAMTENPLTAVDDEANEERIALTKSYRSTKQIVEFTKYFAPGGEMIEPFNREGSKPVLIHDPDDRTKSLLQWVDEWTKEGYETTAIICKTRQESDAVAEALKGKVAFHQINEETHAFEKGLLIVPVYLAKGIEFDAVIIPDATDAHYGKESDRTLFYTACTRAMHALTIIADGKPCRFLEEAAQETYVVK